MGGQASAYGSYTSIFDPQSKRAAPAATSTAGRQQLGAGPKIFTKYALQA